MTTEQHPPHHPPSTETPPHWGRIESHLLFDPARYAAYSAAFHVAGHHWTRHRLSMDRFPAGLRMSVDEEVLRPPEREQVSVVEATAVLVEALAIEAAVYADDGIALGYDLEMDWDLIGEHCGSAHHDARRRGCGAPAGSVQVLLGHANWRHGTGRKVLRDWVGISALADALGHGQVLEADEVLRMLRR